HLLCGQGWIERQGRRAGLGIRVHLTSKGRMATIPSYLQAYDHAAAFLKCKLGTVELIEEDFPFNFNPRAPPFSLKRWVNEARHEFYLSNAVEGNTEQNAVREEIYSQLMGSLSRPIAVALKDRKIFDLFAIKTAGKTTFDGQTTPEAIERVLKKNPSFNPVDSAAVLGYMQLDGWIRAKPDEWVLSNKGKEIARQAWSSGVPVA